MLSLDHRLARPGPDLDDEAGLREPGTDEIGGIAHQLLDVDRPTGAGRAPRDVEQAGDDVDDTHDLRLDDREPARDVVGHDGGRQVLAQQLQVPGDGVERRADLVRDLGHHAAGQREALGAAQASLHLEQQRVEMLHLMEAPVELAGRLVDAGPQLFAEPADARHHLVEVLCQQAELVGPLERHGRRHAIVPDRGDRLHEPADRTVDDELDRDAHADAHEDHGDRAQRQRPEPDPRRQLVGAGARELHRDRAGHGALERDRRHHLPGTAVAGRDRTRDDVPVPHLVAVAPVERQARPRDVGRDDGRLVGMERQDVELDHGLADVEQALDQRIQRLAAFQLLPVAEVRGDLTRVDDGPGLEILLDRPVTQAQVDPREPERDDEDRERAEQGELVPNTEAHAHLPRRRTLYTCTNRSPASCLSG